MTIYCLTCKQEYVTATGPTSPIEEVVECSLCANERVAEYEALFVADLPTEPESELEWIRRTGAH